MMKRFFILSLMIPFLLFAEESLSFKVIKDKAAIPLLNPSLQNQKIEKIQLPNGLQAILVSDPEVKQSAVTMTVLAGSWQDPDAHLGLAHFLEHMLFMGTSEYPEESSFTRFLTEHGGQTNAYTHGDYTGYMFSLNTEGLKEGLKRFSSFFKSPLFNPSGVSRELNAIDSEFAQGFNSEDVRQYHVLKQLASPLHPFSRFQTGNSSSLATATTQDLKQWFDAHYSANLMKLYVLSNEPLEEIKKWVVEDFSSIPDKGKKRFALSMPLFKPEALGKLLKIAPRNSTQSLTLIWAIPEEFSPMIESRPVDLICASLAYEGKNSLSELLKKEGLADSLKCYPVDIASMTYLFEIEIKLTSKGLAEYPLVIERVFQTLHMIAENPLPEYIFQDYASLLKQRYQFEQRDEPFDWAMNQASILATEPIETYPELTKTLKTFDQKAVTALLKSLTPQNAIFVLTAPFSKLKTKEPLMQIPYELEPIKAADLEKWSIAKPNPAVTLPPKNPFLAKSFPAPAAPLISKNTYPALKPPQAILENAGGKILYMPDPFYQVPRTSLLLEIQTPEIKDGKPMSVVMADIYAKALKDFLSDLIDQAKNADLEVSIERALGSIQISLEGFTESLKAFFPYLIPQLKELNLTPQKFEVIKEILLREYENNVKSAPMKQAFDKFKSIILERYTNFTQKRNAIGKITYPVFQQFQESLFKQTYIKGIAVGSLSKEDAKKLIDPLNAFLHAKADSNASPFQAKIKSIDPEGGPHLYSFSTTSEGSALFLVLEADPFSARRINVQDILSQDMSESFFTELRTKQQTGYIVMSSSLDIQKHLFTYFGVQSSAYTPTELLWRFELFIETYRNDLAHIITKARFESLKSALKKILSTPPATLKLFSEELYKLAFDLEDFAWIQKRLEDLEEITYEEFLELAKGLLSRENKRRAALMINGQHSIPLFKYNQAKKSK